MSNSFHIRQNVFKATGEISEKLRDEYIDALMDQFVESGEAVALGCDGYFAQVVVEYGLDHHGITPDDLTPALFSLALFEHVPSRVLCAANDAKDIVDELRAFWAYADRVFGLVHAAACTEILDNGAESRLQAHLTGSTSPDEQPPLARVTLPGGHGLTFSRGHVTVACQGERKMQQASQRKAQ